MLLAVGLIIFSLIVALVLFLLTLNCKRTYYCPSTASLLYGFGATILLLAAIGGGVYYFSIPTLEESFKAVHLVPGINPKVFEGKAVLFEFPPEFQQKRYRVDEIRAALCQGIKQKMGVKNLVCKFYGEELDYYFSLPLKCNIFNICEGPILYREGATAKESLVGWVKFRF
jgi:hypothetical protein